MSIFTFPLPLAEALLHAVEGRLDRLGQFSLNDVKQSPAAVTTHGDDDCRQFTRNVQRVKPPCDKSTDTACAEKTDSEAFEVKIIIDMIFRGSNRGKNNGDERTNAARHRNINQ